MKASWLTSASVCACCGSPGFALTTIVVLGLGIRANAAVFSVVDAVLRRSLPLRDPKRFGGARSG